MTNQLVEDKSPSPIRPEVRAWMRSIGFVHESEVEDATCTTNRIRKSLPLRPIRFGLETWYALEDIQQFLIAESARALQPDDRVTS